MNQNYSRLAYITWKHLCVWWGLGRARCHFSGEKITKAQGVLKEFVMGLG